MFLVISCWKLVVLSWFHQRRYKHDKFRQANILLHPNIRLHFVLLRCILCISWWNKPNYGFRMGMCLKGFWLVCHCPVWQYVYIKYVHLFWQLIFLTMVNEIAIFFTSFTFLAVLPRLFLGSTLIAVASNWAAKVTFSFRFFSLEINYWFGGLPAYIFVSLLDFLQLVLGWVCSVNLFG